MLGFAPLPLSRSHGLDSVGDRRRMSRRTRKGSAAAPLFCPRCRRAAPPDLDRRLCPECGDTVIPQGFCLVCERYWLLPVGTLCPKHDIDLELPASSDDAPGTAEPADWVTVMVFPHSLAARAPRIRLEAEGIRTFLEGERMGEPGMHHAAIGGVKLKVPADQFGDASRVLAQDWSLGGDEGEVDDF